MSVVTKDSILEKLKEKLGDITDDMSISIIEDITDTIGDLETRLKESGDWKKKYESLDNEWRNKYTERFYSMDNVEEEEEEEDGDEIVKTKYEDLFEIKGED